MQWKGRCSHEVTCFSETAVKMAEGDDVPVLTGQTEQEVEHMSTWPFRGDLEKTTTGWTNLIKDVIHFLSVEEPYSVKADKDGMEMADFMIKNADLASAMESKKEELIQESKVEDVTVTYFKNWAHTLQGLMLYARPSKVEDVRSLVEACGKLGIKVGEK